VNTITHFIDVKGDGGWSPRKENRTRSESEFTIEGFIKNGREKGVELAACLGLLAF
jgi:hypothetical protein